MQLTWYDCLIFKLNLLISRLPFKLNVFVEPPFTQLLASDYIGTERKLRDHYDKLNIFKRFMKHIVLGLSLVI